MTITEKIKDGLTVLGIVGTLGGLGSLTYLNRDLFHGRADVVERYILLHKDLGYIRSDDTLREKKQEYRQLHQELDSLISSPDAERKIIDYYSRVRKNSLLFLATIGFAIPPTIQVSSYIRRMRLKKKQ